MKKTSLISTSLQRTARSKAGRSNPVRYFLDCFAFQARNDGRIIGLLLAVILISCRPVSVIPEDPGGGNGGGGGNIPGGGDEETVSIAFLKALYKGAPVRITQEYRISGAVISSDDQGNFYRTLVLDDGTGGIELKLDMEHIFKLFEIHTRVAVRCNGLWLGSYGGTLQLGAEPFGNYETQFLSETDIAEHLAADTLFYGEVRARRLDFSELSPEHISTYVAFDGVQFAKEEQGLGWADINSDTDTDRSLVDISGDTLAVRTSRFAYFAGWKLPAGNGSIEGVLSYFNGGYKLVVCDAQKAIMKGPRF